MDGGGDQGQLSGLRSHRGGQQGLEAASRWGGGMILGLHLTVSLVASASNLLSWWPGPCLYFLLIFIFKEKPFALEQESSLCLEENCSQAGTW